MRKGLVVFTSTNFFRKNIANQSDILHCYRHLQAEPAGIYSSPDFAQTLLLSESEEVSVEVAQKRVSEIAASAAQVVCKSYKEKGALHFSAVLHCQSTLDEQFLSSACLKVLHECNIDAEHVLTIDQTGTSGFYTLLELANARLKREPEKKLLITASDKWQPPFPRNFHSVGSYSDSAGACILEKACHEKSYPVEILSHVTLSDASFVSALSCAELPLIEKLASFANDVIALLLSEAKCQLSDIDGILGDPLSIEILEKIYANQNLKNKRIPQIEAQMIWSSASPFRALNILAGIEKNSTQCRLYVVWSISLSGHAGAMLVQINSNYHDENNVIQHSEIK